MARGNFRTGKDVCVYCGARASSEVCMYRRGLKRQPVYLCERCFDRSANEEEKEKKETLKVKVK